MGTSEAWLRGGMWGWGWVPAGRLAGGSPAGWPAGGADELLGVRSVASRVRMPGVNSGGFKPQVRTGVGLWDPPGVGGSMTSPGGGTTSTNVGGFIPGLQAAIGRLSSLAQAIELLNQQTRVRWDSWLVGSSTFSDQALFLLFSFVVSLQCLVTSTGVMAHAAQRRGPQL